MTFLVQIMPYTTLYSTSLLSPSDIFYNLVQTSSHLATTMSSNNIQQPSKGFILTKMCSQSTTMFLLDEILPHRTFGNAKLTSFEQHTILDYEIQPLHPIQCNRYCTRLPSFSKIRILWIQICEFLEPNHFNLHLY